MIYITVSMSD